MDLNRIVIRRRRDLASSIESRVRDGQARLVLADQRRRPPLASAADLAQVPQPHVAVQRGGGDEVRESRVQGEAADFLIGELVDVRAVRGSARVVPAEAAVEAREVEGVRVRAGDFDAGEGFVEVWGGRGVDLDGAAGGQIEFADGGVVGGGVEVVGVGWAEVEGADRAGVQLEACDGGFRVGVVGVGVGVFGLDGFGFGGGCGLGGVEDAEVAHLVAGEDQGFVGGWVEAEGVDALGGDFYSWLRFAQRLSLVERLRDTSLFGSNSS